MEILKKLGQLLSTLGVNAIPAGGWLFEGWSSGTTLGVYWFENVAASLLAAVLIELHCRLAPRVGHVHYHPRSDTRRKAGRSFQSFFLPTTLIFSMGQGFFLASMIFVLTMNGHAAEVGIDWRSLLKGCGLVLVLLFVDFVIALWGLRKKPFSWVERMAVMNHGRVVVVHLTIIFGLIAIALTGANHAFFVVFFVLKTLSDLSGYLPQWNPDVLPPWLCRIMDKIPGAYPGKSAQLWAKEKAGEVARMASNEKPILAK